MADLVYSLRGIAKSRLGRESFCLRLEALDVPRGGMLALVGPSGCGKSTALDLLAGVLRPDAVQPAGTHSAAADAQRFLFAPEPGYPLDMAAAWQRNDTDTPTALRKRSLGYVLQTGGLLPFLTAGDNIMLRCRMLGTAHKQADNAAALANSLGITHLLQKYPAALSVGERQRTAIAAALAHSPAVVLADEPTAALDPAHAGAVLNLFAAAARSRGITVVLVTHQAEAARAAGFSLVPVETTLSAAAEGAGSLVTAQIYYPTVGS